MLKNFVPVASTTDCGSPNGFVTTWQNGQWVSPSNIRRPSQYRRHGQNSQSNKWRPSEEEGTMFSQSQAWRMVDERARALECTSGALYKRAEKQASSTTCKRNMEHSYISLF